LPAFFNLEEKEQTTVQSRLSIRVNPALIVVTLALSGCGGGDKKGGDAHDVPASDIWRLHHDAVSTVTRRWFPHASRWREEVDLFLVFVMLIKVPP